MNTDPNSTELLEVKTSELTDVKSQRARGVIDWRPAFLAALESVGVINAAARAAHVSVMTVWRERKGNAEFASAYDESLQCGARLLEEEATRRAVHGVRRIRFNPKTGQPYMDPATGEPYIEHEYSDPLLLALLKRHYAEYRDKASEVHVSQTANNTGVVISLEKLKEIQEYHRAQLLTIPDARNPSEEPRTDQ